MLIQRTTTSACIPRLVFTHTPGHPAAPALATFKAASTPTQCVRQGCCSKVMGSQQACASCHHILALQVAQGRVCCLCDRSTSSSARSPSLRSSILQRALLWESWTTQTMLPATSSASISPISATRCLPNSIAGTPAVMALHGAGQRKWRVCMWGISVECQIASQALMQVSE